MNIQAGTTMMKNLVIFLDNLETVYKQKQQTKIRRAFSMNHIEKFRIMLHQKMFVLVTRSVMNSTV